MLDLSRYTEYYKKNKLLPDHIENLRNNIKCVYQYPSPKICSWEEEYYSKSIKYEEFLEKSCVGLLATIEFGHRNNFMLMNKVTPHAVLDTMIIDGSKTEHLFTNKYSTNKKAFLIRLFEGFLKMAKFNRLYPYIAFNFEPYTKDRDSGQSVNRFHVHFIARKYSELNNVVKKSKKITDFDEIAKRRLTDESTFLFTTLAYEIAKRSKKFNILKLVKPFTKHSPIPGQIFEVRDRNLLTIKFLDEIESINEIYIEIFEKIHKTFFYGKTGFWKRPVKISKGKLNMMLNGIVAKYQFTPKTGSFLRQFYNLIYKLSQKDINLLKSNRRMSTFMIPMSGPCVNYAIFTKANKICLYVRSQLFSDLGGAGLQIYKNTLFKIKRNYYTISQKELKERQIFQQDMSRTFLSLKDSL